MKQLKYSITDIAMMILVFFLFVLVPIGTVIGIMWFIIVDAGGININSILGILVAAFFVAIVVAIVGPYDAMD